MASRRSSSSASGPRSDQGLEHGYASVNWRIRCSIGEMLIEQGMAEQARASLESLLIDLQPGDTRSTLIRVRHGLYRACRHLGRHEEALRHLERYQEMERHRTVHQLKAQSELFVTRFEAEQSRLQAERARLDAQAQRNRAAEFEAHAMRDQLTGLGNRRLLDRELPLVLQAADDLSLPVTLALIDVDHFKRVNDRFGHAVGDQVLVALAQMLREKTRASDLLARIGGEEFLVALPDTVPERASEVCERLRLAVQNYAWDQLADGLAVTLSVGVAHAPPYTSQLLFERADAAMYRAKQEGRNRVSLA
jgi:diguanylate cyclase (GGDEF)-like protein